MSPLEVMKRLQAADPFVMNERAGTAFCFACGSYDKHAPGCPVLALPQIVAALEATQALVDAHAQFGLWRVIDDPKELGDRQQAALTALWELGIKPADPMQRVVEV